ncbi:Lrp Transcriptional regulators [Rhabdaerophilaceae bacterium]
MDNLDIKLLDALQRDARLTNNELAEKVGLSASQCSRRRSQLEAEGIIRGYAADLDPAALGFGVIAFVQVTLATHSPDNARRFLQLVSRVPEVQEAFAVTGEADYLVRLVARDLPSLAALLNETFLPHESVAHVRSSIALATLKDTRILPVSEGPARR